MTSEEKDWAIRMRCLTGNKSIQDRPTQAGSLWGRLTLLVAVLACLLLGTDDARSADSQNPPFRVGFASSMFTDVNENDARAAVKVWSRVLAQDRGIPVDPEPRILNGVEAITKAMRGKLIDAVALTTYEYWALNKDEQSDLFIAGVNEGSITEEYVLLVHRDSRLERPGDLQGRSLIFFQSPRMSLAPAWFDTILIKSGFRRATEFCGRITQMPKLSRTVLPVFFRQIDACVVTRRGFQTMSELNPQVGRQLKVIASSSPLVPSGFCFRKDYTDPAKDKLVAEIGNIHTTPSGQQVLTIFQCDSLEVQPISCLDSAIELLNEHRRLLTRGSGSGQRQPN